jgi:hypothetical protein
MRCARRTCPAFSVSRAGSQLFLTMLPREHNLAEQFGGPSGAESMRKIKKPRTSKPRTTNKRRGVAGWGSGDRAS